MPVDVPAADSLQGILDTEDVPVTVDIKDGEGIYKNKDATEPADVVNAAKVSPVVNGVGVLLRRTICSMKNQRNHLDHRRLGFHRIPCLYKPEPVPATELPENLTPVIELSEESAEPASSPPPRLPEIFRHILFRPGEVALTCHVYSISCFLLPMNVTLPLLLLISLVPIDESSNVSTDASQRSSRDRW